nr:tRNA uridine-5-carboxymethylaminomethyl(34) synthesis GTPase MnmE [Prevotella sp.]
MQKEINDTICALATPAGGAIGVLRISGPQAIDIADKLFKSASHKDSFSLSKVNRSYGNIYNCQGEILDDVLVNVFHSPHSYTGEDSIEISCHGSSYILQQVLHSLIDAGCRQAEPGEYTRRAYLNGKMDLSQSEAVADLVSASNKATHKLALSQLKGHFSNELSLLREQLLKMTSLLELELDFSDHEDLEFADRSELKALAQKIDNRITSLANTFKTGNALKKGIPVAIIGKTNVGKSTLLNNLLHEDKAIVSNIHGTTRDVIEDTTDIHGITFRFIDTAGIRKTTDEIEKIGIERTYKKINEAQIVVWLIDEQPSETEIADIQQRCEDKTLLIVQNKIDLSPIRFSFSSTSSHKKSPIFLTLSAKNGLGITELEEAIYKAANIPEINENSVIVTSARHYEALSHAQQDLSHVLTSMDDGLSGDLIAEDLKMVLDDLSEITGEGRINSQEVLNNIFKHFCIGK